MRAAASNNLAAIERCLAEGTSPNAVNPIGQSALHIAAIWNKKGDQSDCGFGALYQLANIPMAPPPGSVAA